MIEEHLTSYSPKKGVPHQFPAGLEIWRKKTLAYKFEQFEEHLLFDNLIFTIIS